MIERVQLEAFLEIVEHGTILGATRATGRSRATYQRYLQELRDTFEAPELLERAPGQRQVGITRAGAELERRARVILRHWDRWLATTRDALAETSQTLRIGTLAGSFDLFADILVAMRAETPDANITVTEISASELLDAILRGDVDLGFGTRDADGPPPPLRFESFGALPWALILPKAWKDRLPDPVPLRSLDGVGLVLPKHGPGRARIEQHFASAGDAPLTLAAAVEVESTPRIVDVVARGFGPAIVSQFRLGFLPKGVLARRLIGGPKALTAGVYRRRGRSTKRAQALVRLAKARFHDLTEQAPR